MIAGLACGISVSAARRLMAQAFRQQQLDSPDLDARVLISHTLGLDHSALIAAGQRALTPEEAGRLAAAAARRLAHEPVARIIGGQEFWGLSLKLNKATLVPRPETETVVDASRRAVGLAKTVENERQKFRGNTFSGIGYFKFETFVFVAERNLYIAARRRKFDGIRQQIPDNLL